MAYKRWLPNAITLLLAALLVLTQHVWADPIAERLTSTATGSSRTTINYQGYLTDSSGNPVNDPLDMVFRLYNVESGGEALWTETQSAVAVSDGLFSVLLGSGTPISTEIIANNSDLWLGIAVGGDEEMSPREKIASAPYAMLANVPDSSITSAKLADNAVTSSKIAHQFGASSQPLLNFVPRQNDSWDYSYSGTAGAYWREVDISSIVPADAVAVLIRVSYAQAAVPLSQLFIRHKDGTSRAEGALVNSSRQDINAEYGGQRIIYLPGPVKKLEEKTNSHSAQHNIQIAVIGWWEPAHAP